MIDYPTIRNHSPTVGIMDSQIPQTTKVKREKNLQFTGFRPNVGKTFAVFASSVHMEKAIAQFLLFIGNPQKPRNFSLSLNFCHLHY